MDGDIVVYQNNDGSPVSPSHVIGHDLRDSSEHGQLLCAYPVPVMIPFCHQREDESRFYVKIVEIVSPNSFSGVTESLLEAISIALNKMEQTLDVKNTEHVFLPIGGNLDRLSPADLQRRALAIMSAGANYSDATFVCGNFLPHEVAFITMMQKIVVDRSDFHTPKTLHTGKFVKFSPKWTIPAEWKNLVCNISYNPGSFDAKKPQPPILCLGDDDCEIIKKLRTFGKKGDITALGFGTGSLSNMDLCFAIWSIMVPFIKHLNSMKAIFFEIMFHGSLVFSARASHVIGRFLQVFCHRLGKPISACFLSANKNLEWDQKTESEEYSVWQIASVVYSSREGKIEGKYRAGVLVEPTIRSGKYFYKDKPKTTKSRRCDLDAERDRTSNAWQAEKEFRTFHRADAEELLNSCIVVM